MVAAEGAEATEVVTAAAETLAPAEGALAGAGPGAGPGAGAGAALGDAAPVSSTGLPVPSWSLAASMVLIVDPPGVREGKA